MKKNNSDGMKKLLSFGRIKVLIGLCALSYGHTAYAAAVTGSVQGFMILVLLFINNLVIPLLFSIALLFFLINAARYFILGSANEEGQDKARRLAIYGIGAFVFLISIWAIVTMITSGLGINQSNVICPDYMPNCKTEGDTIFEGYFYFGGSIEM